MFNFAFKPIAFSLGLLQMAHSWYPHECCSENDCKPVPCDEIMPQKDGSYLFRGMTFEKEKVKIPPAGITGCHACWLPGRTYCIYPDLNA
jgi:hypothetical protein